tara:strand:- start:243 stop:515 length:273 start_codon:yes stop_codon:yes gene_type:complete
MKLECYTCYFYPANNYVTKSSYNEFLKCNEYDIEKYSPAIRIFGTKQQIKQALNKYCEVSGLNLDEVFSFDDKDIIKEYKKMYKGEPIII